MKALYRRYRPLKLEDVVGQEQVTIALINSLKQKKISHAYLFTGPRGTGKTTVARIFAHEINGFSYELEDDYVDIIEIDGASNRGVDNIRDIREKAMIAPTVGKYKVYIIDEVHMLTKEAFNALLKTLEEPPEHVVFIMATTDAYKVPVTITSRSQVYTFKLASFDTIKKHLRQIADSEDIKIDDDALQIVARRGGGSFRDSLSLLEQISTISSEKITLNMVEKTMGLPSTIKLGELLEAYKLGDNVKITTLLKDLLCTGVKAETLAEELISAITEKPEPELLQLLSRLVEVRAPFAEARLLISLVAVAANVASSSSSLGQNQSNPPLGPRPGVASSSSSLGQNQSNPPLGPRPGVASSSSSLGQNQSNPPLGPRPAGPSPRAAGASPRAAALRIPSREDSFDSPKQHPPKSAPSKNNSSQPMSKFQKFIAERNKSRGGGDGVSQEKNSELNSKLSAIMGGEVENYGGGSPF